MGRRRRSDAGVRPRLPAGFGTIWVSRWPSISLASGSCCRSCRSTPSASTPSPATVGLLVASFSLAQFVSGSADLGAGLGSHRPQAGPRPVPCRHRRRQPPHRPGRGLRVAPVRGPDPRRGLRRQRLGGPGCGHRSSRHPFGATPTPGVAGRCLRGRLRGRAGHRCARRPRRSARPVLRGRRAGGGQCRGGHGAPATRRPAEPVPGGRADHRGRSCRAAGAGRLPARGVRQPGRIQRVRGDLRPLRRAPTRAPAGVDGGRVRRYRGAHHVGERGAGGADRPSAGRAGHAPTRPRPECGPAHHTFPSSTDGSRWCRPCCC